MRWGNQFVKWFQLSKVPLGTELGLGTAGHTVGSAFALKLSSVQGAMAAVVVVIIGLVDNLVIPLFVKVMGL